METILRNKKLNDLLNLIDSDLDLAKSKFLKSKQLYTETLIEVKVQLDHYFKEEMSLKQKLQLDKMYPQARTGYLERDALVTFRTAKQKLEPLKNFIVNLLEDGLASVPTPDLVIRSDAVMRALHDAETLSIKNGAARALDRYHTALHGYLKAVCDNEKISYPEDPSITQLWRVLRKNHPAIKTESPHNDKVDTILTSIGSIVHALNQTRNKASPAHPNETLEEAEAIFVNNATKTVLRYLNTKFK